MDYILTMAPDAARDRLDALRDKLQDQLDAMKERQANQEREMVEMAATWGTWQTKSLARDKEHTDALSRVQVSMEANTKNLRSLSSNNQASFSSLQTSLDGLLQAQETQDAVDVAVEAALAAERASRPVAPAMGAAAAPAPAEATVGGASLAAAKGWVRLVQSISPVWIAVMFVILAFSGVTLAIVGMWWALK